MIFISVIVTRDYEVLARKLTCCCCTTRKREIVPGLPCWLESLVRLV